MAGVDSVQEVRIGVYPLFDRATWKFVQVDFKTEAVRLWGWKDVTHLRNEILSRALDTLYTQGP